MAGSTTNLDLISVSQASKEVTANALFDAASVATLFGRRDTTTAALTWGYYGGALRNNGVTSQIANGTVALAANLTNYVEATQAGAVTANTTAFTAGSDPLYQIVAGAATVTSYIDMRVPDPIFGFLSKSVAAGGTITLTQAEAACNTFEFTGAIPNATTIVVPAAVSQFQVENLTTGAFTLTVKTPAGTGIVVPQNTTMMLYCNGTNVEDSNTAKANVNGSNAQSFSAFGFRASEAANAKQGVAVLVSGTVTVANTGITATSRIFLSRSTVGGTLGFLSYTLIAATSFTINSSSALDTSTVNYLIMEPA